ncbi:hypothetical protein [Methylobacterium dankookense]|uniref:Uncharacterized protein n=1 Tax=Methylobacterium dankookense TaxID=560405 RepID=A0A564G3N7_9HYPH|nr:hypothetical protein [Methylobacterium dankookense]GJD58158.1 hypothetical protein IFDJLNFL_4073 [Methylobacterium dankookense]VUF15109.1 hypothetical protein MTDSW087_04842 [Methylobacterium dankookense]
MSEAPVPEAAPSRQLTVHQINGRLNELTRQRDVAQAQCVILSGEKAEALDLIKTLKAEVERLQGLLSAQAGSSAAH